MINIKFPFYAPKRASFMLAAEQYLAADIKDFSSEELLFTWESPGLSKTDNKGLKYLGKGCFALSYVSPMAEIQFANMKFVSLMGLLVRKAGIDDAYTDGDLVKTGDFTLAQNSFYKEGGSSVMHSTLFYDADPLEVERQTGLKTASFKDHGCTLEKEGLKEFITGMLCQEQKKLTFSQIKEIRKIENGK